MALPPSRANRVGPAIEAGPTRAWRPVEGQDVDRDGHVLVFPSQGVTEAERAAIEAAIAARPEVEDYEPDALVVEARFDDLPGVRDVRILDNVPHLGD